MVFLGSPNLFSYIALLLWIPITLVLFATRRPALATAVSIVGGAVLLPEYVTYHIPAFPPLGKRMIPAMASFAGCMLSADARKRLFAARPMRGVDAWMWLTIAGHIGTWWTNTDTLPSATPRLGLVPYDVLVLSLTDMCSMYFAFLMGRAMFRTSADLRTLCVVTLGFGVLYMPLCLFEQVMSPIVHQSIYGFMQHGVFQARRAGGTWRPMVFMSHGICLARFMLLAILGGAILFRARLNTYQLSVATVGVAIVFLMGKSFGAILLGIILVPLIMLASVKAQFRAAAVFAIIVWTYPLSRGADIFPDEKLYEWVSAVDEDRADSMNARFTSEGLLLDIARARGLFGWGPGSRAHNFDPKTGADITTVDGEWVIVFGERGLIGFLGWYGLYLTPILMARRSAKQLRSERRQLLLSGFSLIAVMLATETLPNASLSFPHFFWSGVLAGAAHGLKLEDRVARMKAAWTRRAQRRRAEPGLGGQPVPTPA